MTEMAEHCEGITALRERLEALESELDADAAIFTELSKYFKDGSVVGPLIHRINQRVQTHDERKKQQEGI